MNVATISPSTEFPSRFWEEAPDAAIAEGTDGRISYWNRAAEVIFGYSAAEAVGHTINELLVPRSSPRLRHPRPSFLGEVYEAVRCRKDGALIYVTASRQTIRSARGDIECVLYTKKDVTSLKVTRDARFLETRYAALLESTPDPLVIVNEVGRIVLVNEHTCTLFGRTRAELIGQPLEVLQPDGSRDAARARPNGSRREVYGLRADGSQIPIEITSTPLETSNGLFVSNAIRDVSHRRRV